MKFAILVFWAGLAVPAMAAECPLEKWFTFKGTEIWADIAHSVYAYRTGHKSVDADGAPNAYHPDDVGRNCFRAAQKGLDCVGNAGYPDTDWWQSVLVADPDEATKAFEQQDSAHKGYFVSMTWLQDEDNPDATDPAKYVDARSVPYLVFPGSTFATLKDTGWRGDVGFAFHATNGKATAFVVADQGGGEHARLGEGSIALFEALGGRHVDPRDGTGLPGGAVVYVVFPGSRKQIPDLWPRTNAAIDRQAQELLAAAGGRAAIAACF